MLENKSVKEIISLIKKKDVSVKEIVGLYFERIKKICKFGAEQKCENLVDLEKPEEMHIWIHFGRKHRR